MQKQWSDDAWDEYLKWQNTDKKTAQKINTLIKSVEREGVMKGLGKPEPLKYRKGYSRRINDADRLAYDVENGILYIFSCKGHYDD